MKAKSYQTVLMEPTAESSIREALVDLELALREQLLPAVADFLAGELSSQQLRDVLTRSYEDRLGAFDLALSRSLARPSDQPQALVAVPNGDGADAQLSFYPVSITGHNLIRLVDALVADTKGGMAEATRLPERLVDLDVTMTKLSSLLTHDKNLRGEEL